MTFNRRLPFDKKLTLVLLLTSCVPLVIATGVFVAHEISARRRALAHEAAATASLVARSCVSALRAKDRKSAQQVLDALDRRPEVLGAGIFSSDGELVAHYDRGERYVKYLPFQLKGDREEYRDGFLLLSRQVKRDGELIGTVFIQSSTEKLDGVPYRYGLIVPALFLGSAIGVYLLSGRLRRALIHPIVELTGSVRHMSVGNDYSLRVEQRTNDEIGTLVHHFNEMLENVQQRERQLQEHRDRLRNEVAAKVDDLRKLSMAVEQSPAAVVITDVHGTIEYVNPQFTRITGYESQEAIGRNPRLLKSHEHPPEFYRELWDTIRSGSEWRGEFRNKRKNGELYWESASIAPVRSADGEISHFVAVKEDITSRKAAERELRVAKESAEAANREKSKFLANMSHEIRTPMHGVLGMTELALATQLTPEQREYLDMVKDSAASLLSILNDILDLSKIEAGKLSLEAVPFDLQKAVGEFVKMLAVQAHKKGLELACSIPADVPVDLVGDPARLRQIVINLLGNAIKFTERGEVVLDVNVEEQTGDEALLQFSVTDTGVGVSPEQRETIFESFSQADHSTSRKYGGSGLGLSISSRLVQMMGGSIGVESRPGSGSRFHFTARFKLQKARAREERNRELSSLAGLPVLVVDGNATNLRILEEILRSWKMDPCCAGSGSEALEKLRISSEERHPYRLVVVDRNMPGADGLEVAATVTEMSGDAARTILMLTSSDRGEEAERCRELGITCYLRKPVVKTELEEAVKKCLGLTEAPVSRVAPRDEVERPVERGRRPLRILMAEDNAVNQKLMVRILEKQGHSVMVAENGAQALEAYRTSAFDVILMDVHMPEMDGFEATAAIRDLERRAGGHVPIVALTANALKGDRERCLQAGMDDYLAKPVSTQSLHAALARVTADREHGSAKSQDGGNPQLLDEESLLECFGDDPGFLREIMGDFLDGYPELRSSIREGLDANDMGKVVESAHSLKGAAGNFATDIVIETMQRLENTAREGHAEKAREIFAEVEGQLGQLREAMEKVVAEGIARPGVGAWRSQPPTAHEVEGIRSE